MKKEMVWFTFDSKGPKWKRSIGYCKDEDQFYMPAVYINSEFLVLTFIGYDGVPGIFEYNHLYVPFSWAKKQTSNKELIEHFDRVEAKLRQENEDLTQ